MNSFVNSNKVSVCSLLLDSKNKVVFDCFLVKSSDFTFDNPAFFVDVHQSQSGLFNSIVEKNSFRKRVQVVSLDHEMEVTAIYAAGIMPERDEGEKQVWDEEVETGLEIEDIEGYSAFFDPRNKFLGTRTIASAGCIDFSSDMIKQDIEFYKIFRILAGVAEGPCIVGHNPLHLSFDKLNFINNHEDWVEKDTGKTKTLPFVVTENAPNFTDSIGIPFMLADLNFSNKAEGKILDKDKNVVGHILESSKNVGLGKGNIQKFFEGCFLEDGRRIFFWNPMRIDDLNSLGE